MANNYKTIVVGSDGSKSSLLAVERAAKIAAGTREERDKAEAAAMLGFDASAAPSAAELAERLVGDGAGAAVVSDGAAGLTLVSGDGIRLVGRLSEPLQGNATGAGDALTAALAAGLAEGVPTGRDAWAETLRTGVAWSAAAVLQPVAGAVDPADVARLLPRVEIEEIA